MTQMLLFEPQATTLSQPTASATLAPNRSTKQVPSAETAARNKCSDVCDQSSLAPKTPLKEHEPIEGVQHMGDLARAVLLRYELAVRRRKEVAQRRKRFANSAK